MWGSLSGCGPAFQRVQPAGRPACGQDCPPHSRGHAGESQIIVTGPSFTRYTCIDACKTPVSTGTALLRAVFTKYSYSRAACWGLAAKSKLGRRPFRQSPYNVNCDTTSRPPPASATFRFILPPLSGKILRCSTFSTRYSAAPSESALAIPSSTSKPGPIAPVTCPSTSTRACLTRWITTRMTKTYRIRLTSTATLYGLTKYYSFKVIASLATYDIVCEGETNAKRQTITKTGPHNPADGSRRV